MAFLFDPGAIVGALSGATMIGLGIMVGSARRSPREPLLFGAFAVLAGSLALVANLGQMAGDPTTALPYAHLIQVLSIPIYVPLMLLATRYASREVDRAREMAIAATICVPAALLLLLYAAQPTLFVRGAALSTDGYVTVVAGPFAIFVQATASVTIYAVALAFVTRQLVRERRPAALSKLALVAAGLAAYSSYRAADAVGSGLLFASDFIAAEGIGAFTYYLGSLVATLGVVGWCAFVAWRSPSLAWRPLILSCASIPFAVGLLELALAGAGIFGFSTVGLWRLAMVALFGYAIVRHRLFDVEVKLRALASPAAYVVSSAAALAALWLAFAPRLVSSPGFATFASLGVLVAVVPAHRLGPAILDRVAPRLTEKEYLYKRKLDVYRAALEEAQGRGMGSDTEQLFLSDLRRGLKITEQEHRILLLVLQSQDKYGRAVPTPAPALAAKFRVERELGRGSFARAVLAEDLTLRRRVVLKQPLAPWLLTPEARAVFLREAQLAASVRHPNVVGVHEVRPDDEPPTIVLEYVSGGSLDERLAREKLSPSEAARVVAGALDGLAAIHRAGIVHRDLKPANVLLDEAGTAKVTDFGIAKPPEADLVSTLAGEGAQPGSVAYMSPEQAAGRDVDARSDVYAAGALLYRALTGRHYLELRGKSAEAAKRAIQTEAPLLPAPDVPARLEPILLRALAKDPAARYASAAEMAFDLREAAAARTVPVTDAQRNIDSMRSL